MDSGALMEVKENGASLGGRGETGGEMSREQLDAMVVEMVRGHADSLLRLARQHSICADDAHDAYQRGFEIFLRHAPRLEPERAPAWMRTVVKHEAMAVRRARQRDLGPAELEADAIEARNAPSPEDRAVGSDEVQRSAEALQRCKPQEVRALWLRAQGNSYDEIQEITGWSYSKVKRCIYEGNQSFLARYAGIESGAECERWRPLLSALVDGEASTDELLELRPHLRRCSPCRAVVRELHRAQTPLAVIFPIAGVTLATDHAEPAGQVFMRVYESVTSWMTERAASSILRAQMLIDGAAGSAAKATAVAATAATVAGGGAVAMEHASRTADARQSAVTPIERPVTNRARQTLAEREQARRAAEREAGERAAAEREVERLAAIESARAEAARSSKASKRADSRKAAERRSRKGSGGSLAAPAENAVAATQSPAPTTPSAGDLDLE